MNFLIPKSFFPQNKFWDDDDAILSNGFQHSGLQVSEDEKKVYVEANVPGLGAEEIEVTFDKGVLWIRGEKKEEEKNKKFYRRSSSNFSYQVAVPGDIDESQDPVAVCKNGVMKVTFEKKPEVHPKKIAVKHE